MSGKKIKVALCLSGEPRSSMASFSYIYETYLIPNGIYETDVYIYAGTGFRALKLYNPTDYVIDYVHEEEYFSNYIKTIFFNLSPNLQNEIKTSLSNISYYSNNIKNTILMFNGINKCFNQIKKPYDLCIRGRFDQFYPSPFSITPIISDIVKKRYDIFIPNRQKYFPHQDTPDEYNDQLAIGNFNSMKIYSNLFDNIPETINKTNSLNSQKWIKYWLDKHNLKIKEEAVDHQLIRRSSILSNQLDFNNFLDQ